MVYGNGGAGKTTLVVDLACHLAAGDAWLGIPVARPLRVLLVENEGPRPHFRRKLRRKLDGWAGSPLAGGLVVLEEPWSRLTLAEPAHRGLLAVQIRELGIDVVALGPVSRSGMNEAGTLQEVRDFTLLLADVRGRAGRAVAFVLVHHENKNGAVSGAWEGAGDTLLHVQGQGHGRTRLYVQEARWSSAHHETALQLSWADGEGFAVSDQPERDEDTIADEILAFVLANGGGSWNPVETAVTGQREKLRTVRDRLLEGGRLIDAGRKSRMELWHADDPAGPVVQEQLRPDPGAPGAHPAPGPGETAGEPTAPLRPALIGAQGVGAHSVPPSHDRSGRPPAPGVDGYLELLDRVHENGQLTGLELAAQRRLHDLVRFAHAAPEGEAS